MIIYQGFKVIMQERRTNTKIIYMKKLLFYIVFCMLSVFANAQYIEFDKADQDGTRRITSTDLFVRNGFTDRNPFYYSITTVLDNKEIAYYLIVRVNGSVHKSIPNEGILLIKAGNGTVIESNNIYKEYETHDLRYLNLYGCYPISKENLEEIAVCGISKIRIEVPHSTIDVEYNESKAKSIAKGIKDRLDCINSAFLRKKTIRDGF